MAGIPLRYTDVPGFCHVGSVRLAVISEGTQARSRKSIVANSANERSERTEAFNCSWQLPSLSGLQVSLWMGDFIHRRKVGRLWAVGRTRYVALGGRKCSRRTSLARSRARSCTSELRHPRPVVPGSLCQLTHLRAFFSRCACRLHGGLDGGIERTALCRFCGQ